MKLLSTSLKIGGRHVMPRVLISLPKAWPLFAIAALFAGVAMTRLGVFAFSNDEGTYLMWARLMRQGYTLYRDIWSDQPPLIMWTLIAAFNLWGESVTVGRVLAVLAATAGLLGMGGVTWVVGGRRAALPAAAMLVLAPLFNWFGRAVMSDVPANAIASLSIFVAFLVLHSQQQHGAADLPSLQLRRDLGLAFLAGALFGASLMIKLVTLPLAVVVLGAILVHSGRQRPGLLLAWAIGLMLVLGLILLPTGLRLAVRQIVGTVVSAREGFPWSLNEVLRRAGQFVGEGQLGIVGLAVVGGAVCVRRPSAARLLLLTWAILALAALVAHTPLYYHHLILALFPLVALAGLGMSQLAERGYWRLAAGLAMLAYALLLPPALPALTQDGTARADNHWRMLAGLESITAPGHRTITDNAVLAFRAGLRMPPALADMGGKRLDADAVSQQMWIRETQQWNPTTIVFVGQEYRGIASYLRWVAHTYHAAGPYAGMRRLWTPEPGGPRIDLNSQEIEAGVVLEGYSLDRPSVSPGESARLALFWSTSRPLGDYRILVHLAAPDGRVVARDDGQPDGSTAMTSALQPGDWIFDLRTLAVPADAFPGNYAVVVEVSRRSDGKRVGSDIRLNGALAIQ